MPSVSDSLWDSTSSFSGLWHTRQRLYGPDLLPLPKLTAVVRCIIRVYGEISFEELFSIVKGAHESDVMEALKALVDNKIISAGDQQRYSFIEDRVNIAEEIKQERAIILELKRHASFPIGGSMLFEGTTSGESSLHTSNTSDCVEEDGKTADLNPFESTRISQPSNEVEDPDLTTLSLSDRAEDVEQKSEQKSTEKSTEQPTSILDRGFMVPSSTRDDAHKPVIPATASGAVSEAVPTSAGNLRCLTAEDYLRRTPPHYTNPKSRGLAKSNDKRYRWERHNTDPVYEQPMLSVQRYCELRDLPGPGVSVTFMPIDKVHYCVLQVGDQSFRSYPTQARSHNRAIEIAAEKAIDCLGITSEMLNKYKTKNRTGYGNQDTEESDTST